MSNSAADQPHYAAPWKRLAAFVIDLPLLFAVTAGARALFGAHGGLECVLSCWLYYAGMEGSPLRATAGKLAFGLQVTDLQGNGPGVLRASVRYWGKMVSLVSLGAGFAMMFFTEKKQAFHDYVAGCVMVDGRAAVADRGREPAART
jgi:uncharacterized RDD family membrane protein YckC